MCNLLVDGKILSSLSQKQGASICPLNYSHSTEQIRTPSLLAPILISRALTEEQIATQTMNLIPKFQDFGLSSLRCKF